MRDPSTNDRVSTDPTQEQIRQRAAEVRRGWSHSVRQRRLVCDDTGWRPPLVMIVDLVREMNSQSS